MRSMSTRRKYASTFSVIALGGLGLFQGAIGCSSGDPGKAPAPIATAPAAPPHTEIKASPETTAATGITHWWIYKRHEFTVLAGFDRENVPREVLRARVVHSIAEIRDASGVFRADSKGTVVTNTLRPESLRAAAHLHGDLDRLGTSGAKVAYDPCSDAVAQAALASAAVAATCASTPITTVAGLALCAVAVAAMVVADNNVATACAPPPPPGGTPVCPSCPAGYYCDPTAGACLINDCGGNCPDYAPFCDPSSNQCTVEDPCSIDPSTPGCDPCLYDPYACGGGGSGGGSCGGGSSCW
jgi:hypothetical protein